ncbi:unnamed protein product (macronuclear) [Paramecium tetraurelia]|uniref:Chromosome undetermined scaffold_154, whole genome shotgun sequence n=1 Tax=Paramecium tetraurelia TaxID=5888 RepID=Q3SD08_PARTE|nr:uncharacterized protein GSPATT00035738001 [Paramecium tetraurelia]CAI44557.1 rab_A53 [Paramecium tetraurelia]CAK66608.1 unnamed protein product [Paramecium tetraurelia]|eukprot:XP_001434005.1 hypothetical protein (macronuclear) [Paramecium tetraurelia strain d4-2]
MKGLNQEQSADYIFKFILIGNSSTGKTSILQYFIKQNCTIKKVQQTVGIEFQSKFFVYKNKNIKLQIWDTAGQERFRSIARTYFKNTIGAILVYDVTSQDSYEALDDWIKDARENGKSDLDIIVVGNKIDLTDQRVVDKDYAERDMRNKDVLYVETSAMTGENVDKCFQSLIDQIYNKIEKGQIEKDEFNPQLKNPLKQNLTTKTNHVQSQSCNC